MPLSVEQHLGYYHQSVPALSGDDLFQTVREDFCADSREYKFHSHFPFTLIYSISLFFSHIALSLSLLTGLLHASAFYLLTFSGEWIALLRHMGSGREFIFSGSNVSECHLWQEPTSTMNTRKDTACWFFFIYLFCFFHHCIHLKHGNHAVHKAHAGKVSM